MYRLISCDRHGTGIVVSLRRATSTKKPACMIDIGNVSIITSHSFEDIPTVFNLYRALGEALEEMCPGLVSPAPNAEAYAQQVRDEADADRIS